MRKINFSIKNFKDLNNKQKRNFLAVTIIILLFLFLVFQNIGTLDFISSAEGNAQAVSQEIVKLQQELHKQQIAYNGIVFRESSLKEKKDDFWLPSKNGNINAVMQSKIEAISRDTKVELRTFGTIQLDSFNSDISTGEFDIACSGTMQAVADFIYKISTMKPKMYWDNCSLRPDNINKPDLIYLSANIKFISINSKEILKLFESKKTR